MPSRFSSHFISSVAASSAATLLMLGSPAQAGPVETFDEVVVDPDDPCRLLVRYTSGGGGLLYSDDGGRGFRVRPSVAFDPAEHISDGFEFGLGADGAALIGSFDGLALGDVQGCGFALSTDPLVAARVSDFTGHPTDPSVSFLLTASASDGERTGIVQRAADGTLTAIGASDTKMDGSSRFIGNRLRVVEHEGATDGLRYYESGLLLSDDQTAATNVVRYSDDGAQTWTEHEVTESGMGTVLLWAVDPLDSKRILLSVRDETGMESEDLVLVSHDSGATREEWITPVSEVSAVVTTENGEVWLGDQGLVGAGLPAKGLWYAETMTSTAEKLAEWEVRCLARRQQDGALFGCSPLELGRIDPATGELTTTFMFALTEDFVECPEDLASVSEEQLCDAWCGATHYAQAPLCTNYDDPNCGPMADITFGGEAKEVPVVPHLVDPLCPHPRDSETGEEDAGMPMADSGMEMPDPGPDGGATTGGDTGGGAPTTGTTGSTGTTATTGTSMEGGSGGCSCSTAGTESTEQQARWMPLMLLAAAYALRRRQRTWLR